MHNSSRVDSYQLHSNNGIWSLVLYLNSFDAYNSPVRRPDARVLPLYLVSSYRTVGAAATCPLRCLLLLGLEGLLAVAPDHDDREEGADDSGEEDDQDHRDANGPDAGKEQRVQDVVLVDEGLCMCQRIAGEERTREESHVGHKKLCAHHEQSPDGVVDEDGSGCDEHAESNEAVELPLLAVIPMLFFSVTYHCECESKERGDGSLVSVRGRCGGSSSQQLAHDGELGSRGGGRGKAAGPQG